MPRYDNNADGDYDQFDAARQVLLDNPGMALGELSEIRAELFMQNVIWEFGEDIAELFDDNLFNDSFTDGGNGSGNQTPDVRPAEVGFPWLDLPGYSFPVMISIDGGSYSFQLGNFTHLGGLGDGWIV